MAIRTAIVSTIRSAYLPTNKSGERTAYGTANNVPAIRQAIISAFHTTIITTDKPPIFETIQSADYATIVPANIATVDGTHKPAQCDSIRTTQLYPDEST